MSVIKVKKYNENKIVEYYEVAVLVEAGYIGNYMIANQNIKVTYSYNKTKKRWTQLSRGLVGGNYCDEKNINILDGFRKQIIDYENKCKLRDVYQKCYYLDNNGILLNDIHCHIVTCYKLSLM